MKKTLIIIPIIIALGISGYIGVFYYKNLRGVGPAISNPPYPIADVIDTGADNPLKLPSGFEISIFADKLPDARVIAFDRFQNVWVSRPKEGIVSVVVVANGKAVKTIDVLTGLDKPHGILFDQANPDMLYIAEVSKVSSVIVSYDENHEPTVIPNTAVVALVDLPHQTTSRHTTRTLVYSSKGEILLSVGSSCNVCNESSTIHASVQKLEKSGDVWKLTPYATGLRNSVFMATNPVDGKTWATEMGRDELGDNVPPDEINIIEEGKNYGWPLCYGNKIHDTQFDKNTYIMDPCALSTASFYDLPAHVAPLGIAFVPEESFWPEEYWNDVLVAYHGSWNRTMPVGYSIERLMISDEGQVIGEEPFLEGWLTRKNEALGRPADLKFMNGALYISDDRAGVIYRVARTSESGGVTVTPVTNTSNLIVVDGIPAHGASFIYHTLPTSTTFTGSARGTMFFEATFPVIVTDDNGTIVAQGLAHAESDWMSENFVPFSATLTKVDEPTTANGKLSFKKDNPSGLPEHEYVYTVPVSFVQ